jgi:succinate dehydrogenase flavin-adding protein (antitoxin of CptAB toxin-antitoxin module)
MNSMPDSVLKFFWGDDLKDLNWENHKDYIAKTILEKGDSEAIRWLLGKADRAYLKNLVSEKRMDVKSKNFWNIYL